jgi:hypothetical protein
LETAKAPGRQGKKEALYNCLKRNKKIFSSWRLCALAVKQIKKGQ